jgi:hypothetical protein
LPFTGAENLLAAIAARTREVKAVKKLVDCGSLGLFLGVSASNSTGASRFSSLAHDLYDLDHFVPLLSTSYA